MAVVFDRSTLPKGWRYRPASNPYQSDGSNHLGEVTVPVGGDPNDPNSPTGIIRRMFPYKGTPAEGSQVPIPNELIESIRNNTPLTVAPAALHANTMVLPGQAVSSGGGISISPEVLALAGAKVLGSGLLKAAPLIAAMSIPGSTVQDSAAVNRMKQYRLRQNERRDRRDQNQNGDGDKEPKPPRRRINPWLIGVASGGATHLLKRLWGQGAENAPYVNDRNAPFVSPNPDDESWAPATERMRDQTSLLNIGDYRGLVPVLFDASKYVGAYAANKFSQRAAAASVAPTVVGAAKAASSNWFLPWMIGDAGAGVALKALWKQPWDYKQLLDFNSTDPSWFLTEGHDLGNYRTGSHVGLGYDSRGVPRLFHFNDGRYQAWNKGDVVSNGTLNPRIYYKPNNGAGNSVYAVPDEAEIRQALAGYPGVADHIIANMNDEGYGPYNNILRTSIPTSGDLYYGSGNREFKINLAPNRSAQNNEIHRLGLKRYVDSTVTNNLNARINDLVNLHRRLTAPPSGPRIEGGTGSDTTPEQPESEFGPPRMRTPSRF